MSQLNIASLIDGWEYKEPYYQHNFTVSSKDWYTLYDSRREYPKGSIVFGYIATDTPYYTLKIGTTKNQYVLPVEDALYGQIPAGFNTPSGILANTYISTRETLKKYPVPVSSSTYNPVSTVAFLSGGEFPFKDGVLFEVKVNNPPMFIFDIELGFMDITDEEVYEKSLQKIFGGK